LQRFRVLPAKPTVSNIGNRPKPVRLTGFAERQLWNISEFPRINPGLAARELYQLVHDVAGANTQLLNG
jgi:hypothetical protein